MPAQSMRKFRLLALRALMTSALAIVALGLLPAVAQTPTPGPDSTESNDKSAESELTAELPPPDLPASNQQGYQFEIDSVSKIDLDSLAKEAPVYQLNWKEPSERRAARIAEKLGIDGDVVDRGNGTFDITGDAELYLASNLIQFFSDTDPKEGELPSDENAISIARDWLRQAGLLPNDADDGDVVSRSEETRRVVVQFLPLEPENLLSAYPSVIVTEGPSGEVIEVSVRWPEIDRFDLYQLRDAREAWQEVRSGQAFVEVQLPEGVADKDGVVQGSASYSSIDLGYTTAGLPGGSQYLQPVYIFSGRLATKNSDKSYRIRAYVSAVANSGAPVG